MNRLPRTGEEIFSTGKTFTPSEMPRAWDMTMDELEAALGSGGGGGGGDFSLFTLSGRIQADADHPPTTSPSTALALVLPVGFTWLQPDGVHTIAADDGDKLLSDLPANFQGYLGLQVLEEEGARTWRLAPSATRPAPGSGTLCYIETDADGITLLDGSEARADVIPVMPLLLRRLRALEGAASGGGGGGGGSTPGPAPFWEYLKRSEADTGGIVAFVEARESLLRAELLEAIANGGRRPQATPLDHIVHEHALTRQMAGRDQPNELERSASANIIGLDDGTVYGVGGAHPNFLLATNLTLNEDGSFEP